MSYSVLIVDDSALIRQSLQVALSMGHFPIGSMHTANDGRQALDILRKQYVDFLFLDLNMPGMDGFEVLEELRRSREWRSLPVIVVSTEINRNHPRLMQAGIQGFVVKPFKPEEICRAASDVFHILAPQGANP